MVQLGWKFGGAALLSFTPPPPCSSSSSSSCSPWIFNGQRGRRARPRDFSHPPNSTLRLPLPHGGNEDGGAARLRHACGKHQGEYKEVRSRGTGATSQRLIRRLCCALALATLALNLLLAVTDPPLFRCLEMMHFGLKCQQTVTVRDRRRSMSNSSQSVGALTDAAGSTSKQEYTYVLCINHCSFMSVDRFILRSPISVLLLYIRKC